MFFLVLIYLFRVREGGCSLNRAHMAVRGQHAVVLFSFPPSGTLGEHSGRVRTCSVLCSYQQCYPVLFLLCFFCPSSPSRTCLSDALLCGCNRTTGNMVHHEQLGPGSQSEPERTQLLGAFSCVLAWQKTPCDQEAPVRMRGWTHLFTRNLPQW